MPDKTQAQQWLEDLGFSSLPPELKADPLDPAKVDGLINKQHEQCEKKIINDAPPGIPRNKEAVINKYAPAKNQFEKLNKAKNGLLELRRQNKLAEEIQAMSDTYKNGSAKDAQNANKTAVPSWVTAQKESYDEYVEKWNKNQPLAGMQPQVGTENLFLYLINLLMYRLSSGLPDPFNPTAPENDSQYGALKGLDKPEDVKEFVEEAKAKFGDDIEFEGLNNAGNHFTGIKPKNEDVKREFDDWVQKRGSAATPEEKAEALKKAKADLHAAPSAKLT